MMQLRIIEEKTSEIIVDKSRFIAILMPLNQPEDVKQLVKSIATRFPKARHYPYAYIFDERSQSSDDGEPSGTAGRPLLSLLTKRGFNRVLIVVVRYYGGIKLGAGRLLRTYVDAANQTLEQATTFEETSGFHTQYQLEFAASEIIHHKIAHLPAITCKMDYTNSVIVDLISPSDVRPLINEWLSQECVPIRHEMITVLVPVSHIIEQ